LAKIDKMKIFEFFEKSHFFYWIRSKTVSGVFHYLQNVKIADFFLISQFLPILANISHMFKSFKSRFEKSW
jgi:hypothetical protein